MLHSWFGKCSVGLGVLALVMGLTACGDDGDKEDPSATAQIVSFEADRASFVEGESSILRWTTKNAVDVTLVAGGFVMGGEALPTSGELVISPIVDTTYQLQARGKNGASASKTLVVEVTPFGVPTIVSFEATPTEIPRGEEVELSWSTRGATSVVIGERGGRTIATAENAEGSTTVTPTASTTYVLYASNEHGTSTEEISVELGRRPTISLTVDRATIDFGEAVTLSWEAEGAETVIIRDPTGETLHEAGGEANSFDFTPQKSGVYTATARSVGGETAATQRISIRPVIEVFHATAHGEARTGDMALVEWTTRGAEELVLMSAGGHRLTIPAHDIEQGSVSAPVAGGGFILQATSGSLTKEATALVQMTDTPLIRKFEAGEKVIAGHGQVGTSTVDWEIDGASTVRLEVVPGGLVDLTNKSPRIDGADITLTGKGSLILTASNAAGDTVMEIPSPVDPVPTIQDLFAAPSRVGSGEAIQVHWRTIDADSIAFEVNGTDENSVDPEDVNGFFTTGPISAPSTYRVRAYSAMGFEVVSDPLVVEVGAPNALSFTTGDGRTKYPLGATFTLEWQNDGGRSLEITDETGVVVCSSTDWLEIREGECSVTLPNERSEKTYRMTVSNASGSDSLEIDVDATNGPIIEEFYVEFDEITEGQSVHFLWDITKSNEGGLPTLELVDNHGNTYDMRGVPEADRLNGSIRFTIPEWRAGGYTFTLTANDATEQPFSAETYVMVYGIPVVDGMVASPEFAEEEGDEV